MQISLKWTYNGHPLRGRPPPCNVRTKKQYVQGGASLPEPPLFTCSDPLTITNIARPCAAQQACGLKSVQFATSLQAETLHCRIARRGPTQDCNCTRHVSKRDCSAASYRTTNDTTPTPGGALRPLDPGSSSLACEPARRPRRAGRPDSSDRQSGAAARTSRTQRFSPISMLVM